MTSQTGSYYEHPRGAWFRKSNKRMQYVGQTLIYLDIASSSSRISYYSLFGGEQSNQFDWSSEYTLENCHGTWKSPIWKGKSSFKSSLLLVFHVNFQGCINYDFYAYQLQTTTSASQEEFGFSISPETHRYKLFGGTSKCGLCIELHAARGQGVFFLFGQKFYVQ